MNKINCLAYFLRFSLRYCLRFALRCCLLLSMAVHSNLNAEEQSNRLLNSKNITSKKSQFTQWQQASSTAYLAAKNTAYSNNANLTSYSTDDEQIRTLLLNSSNTIIISLPLPNGDFVDFELTESRVIASQLAQKYPNIKTFTGVAVNNASNTGRFDITPNGFHGMFYHDEELVFVEPETTLISSTIDSVLTDNAKQAKASKQTLTRKFNHNSLYQSYYGKKVQLSERADYQFHQPKAITTIAQGEGEYDTVETLAVTTAAKSSPSQSAIKTYRLAISVAAEYTEFNGGTVDSAMAEIITLVNRLNEVYQRDLAIKLELVGDNDLLIFTDADNDPFTNSSDDGEINTQVIDDIIGNDSYDVGHVVGTAGGGLAVLKSVCNRLYKADGVTGTSTPNNDAFYIDYVAHEIGHQFGADHTFNGTAGACLDNRVANAAYEVGSGSTIMSYAGICGSQNLQTHSDAYFHSKSIEQVNSFITLGNGRNCGTITGDVNNTAIVDAGADFTIPANTPFILSGSASDVDDDSLTYSWQQFDLGTVSSSVAEQIDDGTRPLFRVWSPSAESSRVLPKLADILASSSTIGEVLPSTDRSLNFRLLVRDGEGGVSFDAKQIIVVNTGEAFMVEEPVANDTWSTNEVVVNWQVAQTDADPIDCSAVDILLSRDGGSTFSNYVASGVNNNGVSEISLSNYCPDDINTPTARIKVACRDNIFFAINNGDFIINKSTSVADLAITSQQDLTINQGERLTISSDMFTYACGKIPTDFSLEAGDNYTVLAQTVIPDSDFFGTLTLAIITQRDGISSDPYNLTVTVLATVVDTVVEEDVITEIEDTVVEEDVITEIEDTVVEEDIITETETTETETTETDEAVSDTTQVTQPTKSSSGSMFWLLTGFLLVLLREVSQRKKARETIC